MATARDLPITVDIRTTRLIKFATAAKAAGLLPDEASGLFLAHARAVRMLCESDDYVLVEQTLKGLTKICAEIDEPQHREAVAAARAHIAKIRTAITREK